jgi:hypothetical protein
MPIDSEKALRVWARYAYCRDNGHEDYVKKADLCERYFAGDQWDPADRARLRMQRRPALTINKILSTISNVMGEQIYNRSEISFRPRSGSPGEIADTLTKVFKQISDNNQLPWVRSDVFADGAITSRGYYDARIRFTDSMQGEVEIKNLNPKNVLIDPDGEEYDPDTWNEVITSKWLTPDDIAVLYNKEDAERLKRRSASSIPYGYDAIDRLRDRFGNDMGYYYGSDPDMQNVTRNIRVIERQWRTLDNQLHFVSPETGDMRPVPETWDRDRIAYFVKMFGFQTTKKLIRRIKWIVVADDIVLHEEWSPYKHFTVVPYFPYFRHGNTVGLVENLIGPQELLNKVSSQELHVVNTTANSGWMVRAGALANLSVEELETRGAETGLVIEVTGEGALKDNIDKITPNTVPTGLERITYKAEEHIKTISGVSDSMQGMDREDVAAKAIQAKRQAGSTNLAKPMDSLVRSDYMLARNVLDLIQGFYTEHRILTITKDRVTGESEEVEINKPTPEGFVVNDLTLGEYDVIISSVPQRETLEDSQFEQAMAMREAGIPIPDEVLIDSSRLIGKAEIVKKLQAATQSPEARAQAEAAVRLQQAEVAKTEGEANAKHADADLKRAKAAQAAKEAMQPPEADNSGATKLLEVEAKIDLEERKFEHQKQLDFAEMQEDQRQNDVEAALKAQDLEEKRADQRAQAAVQAANPTPEGDDS